MSGPNKKMMYPEVMSQLVEDMNMGPKKGAHTILMHIEWRLMVWHL